MFSSWQFTLQHCLVIYTSNNSSSTSSTIAKIITVNIDTRLINSGFQVKNRNKSTSALPMNGSCDSV